MLDESKVIGIDNGLAFRQAHGGWIDARGVLRVAASIQEDGTPFKHHPKQVGDTYRFDRLDQRIKDKILNADIRKIRTQLKPLVESRHFDAVMGRIMRVQELIE